MGYTFSPMSRLEANCHFKHFITPGSPEGTETNENTFYVKLTENLIIGSVLINNEQLGSVLLVAGTWLDINKNLETDPGEPHIPATYRFYDMNYHHIENLYTGETEAAVIVPEGHYCLDMDFLVADSLVVEPSVSRPHYMSGNGFRTKCFNTRRLMTKIPQQIDGFNFSRYGIIGMVLILVPAIPGDTYSIGQYAWFDSNSNGIFDDGEAGLPDVRVVFSARDGSYLGETLTDEQGYFMSRALPQGEYTVHCVPPKGSYLQIHQRVPYFEPMLDYFFFGSTVRVVDGRANITLPNNNLVLATDYFISPLVEPEYGFLIDPSIGCGFNEIMTCVKGKVTNHFLVPQPGATVILLDTRDNSTETTKANDHADFVFDRLKFGIVYCLKLLDDTEECFNSDGVGLLNVRISTADDL
eukprot:gene19141-22923_t